MALYCDDYEAERDAYLASGAELAYEAHVGPTRTCWVDTAATLGFMVELLEPSPIREKGFAMMRTAAQRWDGKDPITRFCCDRAVPLPRALRRVRQRASRPPVPRPRTRDAHLCTAGDRKTVR